MKEGKCSGNKEVTWKERQKITEIQTEGRIEGGEE